MVRLYLLGGFRVERNGVPVPDAAWQRRPAKTLLKLLATVSPHALHREQIAETLWPEAGADLALQNLGKALHAARHALEPELPTKAPSTYLRLADDVVSLVPTHLWIDTDHFR